MFPKVPTVRKKNKLVLHSSSVEVEEGKVMGIRSNFAQISFRVFAQTQVSDSMGECVLNRA